MTRLSCVECYRLCQAYNCKLKKETRQGAEYIFRMPEHTDDVTFLYPVKDISVNVEYQDQKINQVVIQIDKKHMGNGIDHQHAQFLNNTISMLTGIFLLKEKDYKTGGIFTNCFMFTEKEEVEIARKITNYSDIAFKGKTAQGLAFKVGCSQQYVPEQPSDRYISISLDVDSK